MKKLLDRVREPHLYWMLQTMAVVTFGLMIWCAIMADGRFAMILDATIAGFSAANILHNHLHRRRNHAFDRMVEVAEEQQVMIKEVMKQKAGEIAAELAGRIGGDVSIVGPDGPVYPKPTKH